MGNLILGLDVSTKTIGIALFEDNNGKGSLKLLHHVTPKVKPKPETKTEELLAKAKIFEEEFLNKYVGVGINIQNTSLNEKIAASRYNCEDCVK